MRDTTVPYDTMSVTSRTAPLFNKCCFCIPLRTGCFILGYLNLIFNTFHTLILLTFTAYIGMWAFGIDGFETIHKEPSDRASEQVPHIESMEKPFIYQIGVLLIVVLCANIAWLVVNVACLVGLHKKRPGPIRMYVGFAAGRLLLSMAGYVYLIMSSNAEMHTIISHSVDTGLAAYFILVYYIYAGQLERETESEEKPEPPASDISFIYPSKVDKQTLVVA